MWGEFSKRVDRRLRSRYLALLMTLSLHNTLSGRQEVFRPLESGRVSFYSCGPTVYDYAHIGNFRSFLLGDTLRRWLESPLCEQVEPDGAASGQFGYTVTHVMNITDVGHMTDDAVADGAGEDKMELAAARLLEAKKSGKLPEGVDDIDPGDPYAIAGFYAAAFIEDAKRLGMKVAFEADADASLLPRASEHVKGMLEIVVGLLEKGFAYQVGGAVYFDTQAFPDYGSLSGNTLDKIREGAGGRVSQSQQSEKKHPADFLLWKADSSHLMKWDPSALLGREVGLGEGYPGWHIECSAMAQERLAPAGSAHAGVIDIHS
ncbi:Cysteinyl-tRNA synthetase, partial [hydrothermal vent metagenome]